MKRTQIVATLAFAFVLGASIPIKAFATEQGSQTGISTPAATNETSTTATNSTSVSSAADFLQALEDGATSIILDADLTNLNVDITSNLTVNLNDHSITNAKGYRILISKGNVRFTGTGNIIASGSNALTIRGSATNTGANYVTVTVDERINLSSSSLYGVAIIPYDSATKQYGSYGVALNLNGSISGAYGIHVNGFITDNANRPQIKIGSSSTINTETASDSTPIYAAGAADWNIAAATLNGKTGIGIRSGSFTFNNTSIEIDGPMHEPTTGTGSIDGIGAVFQIEHHTAYADQIVLNVNGGTYNSLQGDVFYEYGALTGNRAATQLADINITGGEFNAADGYEIFGGALGNADANIEISGGTFRGSDVSTPEFANFLKNGFKITADGIVIATTGGLNRPGSSTEAPEDPSDPEGPSDPDQDENGSNSASGDDIAPDTGLNQGRGVLTAVGTIIPMLIGACGIIFMVTSQRIFARRKAAQAAEAELEMAQQLSEIIEDEPEPVIERFTAEAIKRDDPTVTPVDTFILQK